MNLPEHGVGEGGTLHEFMSGPLRISTVLQPRPGADRLTVAMNAYCDRKTWAGPPVFMGWPETHECLGHVLRISDPSFFLSDRIEIFAFLGTEHHDPVPPIVAYATSLAHELGIATERIIYFGMSGAGLGALRCALHQGDAVGICVNPTLEPRAYANFSFAKDAADLFRPGAGMLELCQRFPLRFSATAATRDSLRRGVKTRLGFIQNLTDHSHYRLHLKKFCSEFNVPLAGGADPTGRMRSVLFDKPGGHGAVPDMRVVWDLIDGLLAQTGTEKVDEIGSGAG